MDMQLNLYPFNTEAEGVKIELYFSNVNTIKQQNNGKQNVNANKKTV